jgi:5'-nucleotidase
VSAALEGTILGVSSIAFSLASLVEPHDFSHCARWVRDLVAWVLNHPLPPAMSLNVNIPPLSANPIAGYRLTRQGLCRFEESFIQKPDARGRRAYWMQGKFTPLGNSRHCDHNAIGQNFVSVTPMSYDLSVIERPRIQGIAKWQKKFNQIN